VACIYRASSETLGETTRSLPTSIIHHIPHLQQRRALWRLAEPRRIQAPIHIIFTSRMSHPLLTTLRSRAFRAHLYVGLLAHACDNRL
jgi:hypothetical protein